MIYSNKSLNLDNEYWYEFSEKKHIFQECLDEKKFLTHLNFQENHASLEISRYINNSFFDIKKYFDEINSDFILYIHPFNAKKIQLLEDLSIKKQILELQGIEISDKRFINLSNENYNLEFEDLIHTTDTNIMADKILEDILKNHEQKIISKINSNNN